MFNIDDFSVFTGGAISVPLTEKEGALLSSAFFYMLNRSSWYPMADAEWDTLESELSEIIEKVSP